jgi:hypothetical protein
MDSVTIEILTGRIPNRNRKASLLQSQITFRSPTLADCQQASRIYAKQLQVNLDRYKQSSREPLGLTNKSNNSLNLTVT